MSQPICNSCGQEMVTDSVRRIAGRRATRYICIERGCKERAMCEIVEQFEPVKLECGKPVLVREWHTLSNIKGSVTAYD